MKILYNLYVFQNVLKFTLKIALNIHYVAQPSFSYALN
jgi:hypothetical protein